MQEHVRTEGKACRSLHTRPCSSYHGPDCDTVPLAQVESIHSLQLLSPACVRLTCRLRQNKGNQAIPAGSDEATPTSTLLAEASSNFILVIKSLSRHCGSSQL